MNVRSWVRESIKNNRKSIAIVLALSLVGSLGIVYILVEQQYQAERERVAVLADAHMARGSLLIEDIQQDILMLKLLVVRQHGDTAGFQRAAERVLARHPEIQGIALAPGGRINPAHCVGMFDDALYEQDFLQADQEWSKAVTWSRTKGRMAFWHMSDAAQLAFCPVYLPQGSDRMLWGMVIVQMSNEQFFAKIDAEDKEGMAYALYVENPWSDAEYLAGKSSAPLLSHPVERIQKTGTAVLRFQATPVQGWLDVLRVGIRLLVAVLFSLLVTFVVVIFRDLRSQKDTYERLACQDTLTGAYNRRKFETVLADVCQREKSFLLCYMDFDRFKEINDTYGHGVGDQLLQAGAKRLLSCIRGSDMLFRIGGDEFVAFIRDPGTEASRSARVDMLHEKMQQPFHFDAITLEMRISVGYVLYPQDASTSEALVRMADHRMYVEKQRHKE